MIKLEIKRKNWAFRNPFRISYRSRTQAETIEVRIGRDGCVGRGEASGVSYHGETPDSMAGEIEAMRAELDRGLSRSDLQNAMPAGGARNALDCALWDLEAKEAGRRVWELAGLNQPGPLMTSLTISLDDPNEMAAAALSAAGYRLLKLKLGGEGDIERVRAVRAARPDVRLIVDANQAWNEAQLAGITPLLGELGVELIEQPLPADADEVLRGFNSPVPLCADESCHTRTSLPALFGKYSFINIKLDKAGGLTEALFLSQAARTEGLKIMAGCMAGSSLAIAPAYLIGQLSDIVDLDAPLLIADDRTLPISYHDDWLTPPPVSLWG